jgi:hypothetical protein
MVRPRLSLNVLMWFGLLGAPSAWVVQFLISYWFSETACAGPRRAAPVDTATAIATGLAIAVAVAAGLSGLAVMQATKGQGDAPPPGRVHMLGIVGLTISPLFLMIIIFNGIGVLVLPECVQS